MKTEFYTGGMIVLNSYEVQELLWKIKEPLIDGALNQLEDVVYESEASKLGINEIAEAALVNFIRSAITDERIKKRLTNEIAIAIKKSWKEKQRRIKNENVRNRKLWKVSKGKIPCLYQCGHVRSLSKNEIMKGEGINYICASCSEGEVSERFRIYEITNAYKIFGIEKV